MGFYALIKNMAETCPFFETLRCRDRDETEALDLRDRDETETLKNSVSRPRHVSRHYSSVINSFSILFREIKYENKQKSL